MSRCLSAAQDTLKYIDRAMLPPPESPVQGSFGDQAPASFRDLVRAQADNFICKHIWRITLILCFKANYSAALTCVRLSTIIGDIRKVNVACGRFLSVFLSRLCERVKAGAAAHLIETDEEMLAYASGDLQGDPENAWVWTGSESDFVNGAPANPDDLPPSSALLTEKELGDWGGWERVQRLLLDLMEEQQQQRQKQPQNQVQNQSQNAYHQPAHNPTKRLQLSQPDASSAGPPAGASRISIANII
jgi:hypothetical protein